MNNYDFYKDLVNNNLIKYLPDCDSIVDTIKNSVEYSLTVGGKRLRPVLLLASCEFAGGEINTAIPYACAIEYIHTYSLIHDDLPAMDDDDLRRGKPTNHKVYGEDMAILAGDGLLNSAAEIMYEQMLLHLSDGTINNHVKAGYTILSRSGIKGMIAGQVADVENENSIGTAELVRFIEQHKTADLITSSIIAGLYLANADEETINDFNIYGNNIGIAFQILDDILDYEGDQELIGKTLGKDAEQNKCNYVSIYGLDQAHYELHRLTLNAINSIEKYGKDSLFFIELAKSLELRRK